MNIFIQIQFFFNFIILKICKIKHLMKKNMKKKIYEKKIKNKIIKRLYYYYNN